MANDNTEDVISLEDLVRDGSGSKASIAGAPVPTQESSAAAEPSGEAAPAAPPVSSATTEISPAQIDDLLAAEDPSFAASLGDIQSSEMQGDSGAEIDSIDLDSIVSTPGRGLDSKNPFIRGLHIIGHYISSKVESVRSFLSRGRAGFVDLVKAALAGLVSGLKAGLSALAAAIKGGIAWAVKLPLVSKLLLAAALGLFVALALVLKITFKGEYLPDLQEEFLNGFEPIADQIYEFDPKEPMETFQNPLFHPENVVLLDKMVVNLKQPGDGTNPMGMFELYIEAASREAAIEIKDREIEARDVISRTLEQMPYDELVTESGKHKLKVILRKNLNELLTKGRVRKILFKTVVLKP